jgi:hypothetical protein
MIRLQGTGTLRGREDVEDVRGVFQECGRRAAAQRLGFRYDDERTIPAGFVVFAREVNAAEFKDVGGEWRDVAAAVSSMRWRPEAEDSTAFAPTRRSRR